MTEPTTIRARVIAGHCSSAPMGCATRNITLDLPRWRIPTARYGTSDLLELRWIGVQTGEPTRALAEVRWVHADRVEIALPHEVDVYDLPHEVEVVALVLTRPLGRSAGAWWPDALPVRFA